MRDKKGDGGPNDGKQALMTLRHILYTALAALMVLTATSCQKEEPPLPEPGHHGNTNANLGGAEVRRLEVPALMKGADIHFLLHETTDTATGAKVYNYCVEYHSDVFHSRWVAFRFDNSNKARNVERSDEPFAPDPDLDSALQLGTTSMGLISRHTGTTYHRGHLVASADRLLDVESNVQTFYMTNMSPQIGDFNSGYWSTLESIVRQWGSSTTYDTLYVCKGGTIAPGQCTLQPTVNAAGASVTAAVPHYYFMAILGVSGGKYSSIAFWMAHDAHGYSWNNFCPRDEMMQNACSVDSLEALTGIDFFCNLPDTTEQRIERTYSRTAWVW